MFLKEIFVVIYYMFAFIVNILEHIRTKFVLFGFKFKRVYFKVSFAVLSMMFKLIEPFVFLIL